jgi:hypothetical protein
MKAFREEGYIKKANGTGNISRKPLSNRRLIRAALAIASKQQRAAARANSLKTKGEPQ